MKNKCKVFRIIFIVLVVGFLVLGCDDFFKEKTYSLRWVTIDVDYDQVIAAIEGENWDIEDYDDDWAFAIGNTAQEIYDWVIVYTYPYQLRSGSVVGSFADDCLDFHQNDLALSIPVDLKNSAVRYEDDVPLTGIFYRSEYAVVFYINEYKAQP